MGLNGSPTAPAYRPSQLFDGIFDTDVKEINMALDEERVVSADQLPEDPMAMPPPYWRSSGVTLHITMMLEEITTLLAELLLVHDTTARQLDELFALESQRAEEISDEEEMERFVDICNDLWELEHKVKTKADITILMSAIYVEDALNRFCVYNINKNIAELIERLAPPDKLLMVAGFIAQEDIKGDVTYADARALTEWRNAFAHGHCTDRPTKTLRHNHLIHPAEFPGLPSVIASLKDKLRGLVRIAKYLASISKNPYTSGRDAAIGEIETHLANIGLFHIEGTSDTYTIRKNT